MFILVPLLVIPVSTELQYTYRYLRFDDHEGRNRYSSVLLQSMPLIIYDVCSCDFYIKSVHKAITYTDSNGLLQKELYYNYFCTIYKNSLNNE